MAVLDPQPKGSDPGKATPWLQARVLHKTAQRRLQGEGRYKLEVIENIGLVGFESFEQAGRRL
jgi:hypothetical protein